jgi:hypothetical protein
MSRTQESGAYLGGIGTMLGEADVCPSCGQTHPDRQFGFSHGGSRQCPKVVMGSFPILDETDPEALPEPVLRAPAGRRIRDFETPVQVSLGSLPVPRRSDLEIHPRSLSVPWLRPPDLGEVL